MKKIMLTGIITFSTLICLAQTHLEKKWESDSTTIKGPESVLFDATSAMLYVSSMNAGTVVLLDLNGKITNKDWASGLKSNKGSAFFGNKFFTAETNSVAIIDRSTGVLEKRIPVEGAVMLNDLAVNEKGVVFVSDTRTGKVYRIEGDKPTLYLENITGANGLLTEGDDLYVLGSATIFKVSADKSTTKIADGFESGLDGIVRISKTEFILSNFKGILYSLKTDGRKEILLDTRPAGFMSNDISYDPSTKTLYVPSFSRNRIIAYRVL